jgi:hypothetical protein
MCRFFRHPPPSPIAPEKSGTRRLTVSRKKSSEASPRRKPGSRRRPDESREPSQRLDPGLYRESWIPAPAPDLIRGSPPRFFLDLAAKCTYNRSYIMTTLEVT